MYPSGAYGELIMWQDPIVQEARQRREEYAAEFNHDPDAIFEDICRRQRESSRELVSLPPRKPTGKPSAA